MAMYVAFLLVYLSFLAFEDDLGVPASAPWFMGFIIGAIAGAHMWSGDRAGSEVNQKRERTPDGQGFTGGWPLALINALCVLVLLGLGVAHLSYSRLRGRLLLLWASQLLVDGRCSGSPNRWTSSSCPSSPYPLDSSCSDLWEVPLTSWLFRTSGPTLPWPAS